MKSKITFITLALLTAVGCDKQPRPVYEVSDERIFLGSALYDKENCKSCHGIAWDGKGPDAASSAVPVPGFTGEVAADKTPVTYFKAITEGTQKLKTHSYVSLTDKGRWALANFLYSLRKPLPAEKAAEQQKNIAAAMADVRAIYAKQRRWEMGYTPLTDRDRSPKLEEISANVPADGGPGVASDDRRTRSQSGPGADLYRTNCASCHGAYGEGRSVSMGMGVIPGKNMEVAGKPVNVNAMVSTRDLKTSDSIGSGGALKGAHPAGSQIYPNFENFTEAEWNALSEFIRSTVQ